MIAVCARLAATHSRYLLALLLVSCVVIATWKVGLAGRVIARGDLLLYFYPLRDFAAAAVREGQLPLWNPYTFMGAPFLANPQVGFFHPINLLLSWLPAERAVLLQIPLHLMLAGLGAYWLCLTRIRLGPGASFCAALLFGLGGYLGAQVEHINQLQALAWLPVLLGLVDRAADARTTRGRARMALPIALVIAIMFFAGHTQSLYIALFGCGLVWATHAVHSVLSDRGAGAVRALLQLAVIAGAGALALLLVGAQLLPTLELQSLSPRSGGLTPQEVGAFSWRPWVVARALLPGYGDPLFAEYVAYLGVIGGAMALLGAVSVTAWPLMNPAQRRWWLAAAVLCVIGAVLAVGIALPPVFNVAYRRIPGFSLFRVQARWLALFALGAALMAGYGAHAVRQGLRARTAQLWVGALTLAALTWLLLYRWGLANSPEPEYRGAILPGVESRWLTSAVVGAALMALITLMALRNRVRAAAALAAIGLCLELLVAAQFQPYNIAADAGLMRELRPGLMPLITAARAGTAGRTLSLSTLNFDPGDRVETTLIFTGTLSEQELYERLIATKHKEILSPNFSLWYGIPSVDGYDGGLLPTRDYAGFVQPLLRPLPNGAPRPVDGRLREFLDAVPSNRWLDEMGVQFVLADKAPDVFVDDVYYDVLLSQPVSDALTIALNRVFTSTSLGMLLATTQPVTLSVSFADGTAHTARITPVRVQPPNTPVVYGHAVLDWGVPRVPTQLNIGADAPIIVRSITAIDGPARAFVTHPVNGDHQMRIVYSGDTKIYERLNYDASRARRFEDLERRFRDAPRSLWLGGAMSAAGTLAWLLLAAWSRRAHRR